MEKNFFAVENVNSVENVKRYVLLEDNIPYDWDDYDLWGAVLYDCVEKEIITKAYGHGTDLSCRAECCSLDMAVSLGLTTEDEIKEYIISNYRLSFEKFDIVDFACYHNESNPISIPVTIVGGRKGKGKQGTLIYGEKKRNYYGWGRYHEIYDEYAYILVENEVIKINSFDYLKYDTDFVARYNEQLKNDIRAKAKVSGLAHLYAYGMSYSACDTRKEKYSISDYSGYAKELFKATDEIKTAISIYRAEQNRIAQEKREALKKEVLPNIIVWVKENTDKQGDDILKLAEHIFNKRY
jgi:hypothetical protein